MEWVFRNFWIMGIVVHCVALSYWILIRDGAETLIRYPGLLDKRISEVWAVKGLAIFALLGSVIAFAITMLRDLPVAD